MCSSHTNITYSGKSLTIQETTFARTTFVLARITIGISRIIIITLWSPILAVPCIRAVRLSRDSHGVQTHPGVHGGSRLRLYHRLRQSHSSDISYTIRAVKTSAIDVLWLKSKTNRKYVRYMIDLLKEHFIFG